MSEQIYFFKVDEENVKREFSISLITENLLDIVNNNLNDIGIDLFFEIPSKSPVRCFNNLLWNYENAVDIDIMQICSANEILEFVDYAICFTGELNILRNRFYHNEEEDYIGTIEIRAQLSDIKKINNNIYNLAISEFEKRKEGYIKNIEALEIQSLADVYNFLIPLKEKIGEYRGMIFRLHSY